MLLPHTSGVLTMLKAVLFGLAVLLPPTSASAAFCDSVVQQKAYNTSNSEINAFTANSVREAMCNTSWSNHQQFSQSANSAGIDLGYAGFTFGLSDANSASDAEISQAYNKYCHMSASDFESSYSSKSTSIDAGYAVAAWSTCVNKYLDNQATGLFATVDDTADRKHFIVQFKFKTSGQLKLDIQTINFSPPVSACKIGNEAMNPSTTQPVSIPNGAFGIWCEKSTADSGRSIDEYERGLNHCPFLRLFSRYSGSRENSEIH